MRGVFREVSMDLIYLYVCVSVAFHTDNAERRMLLSFVRFERLYEKQKSNISLPIFICWHQTDKQWRIEYLILLYKSTKDILFAAD